MAGVPCAWGSVLIVSIARACCVVVSGRGAFGCTGAPSRKVVCVGDTAGFVIFSCPWGDSAAMTDIVSSASSCRASIGETITLRFTLGLRYGAKEGYNVAAKSTVGGSSSASTTVALVVLVVTNPVT